MTARSGFANTERVRFRSSDEARPLCPSSQFVEKVKVRAPGMDASVPSLARLPSDRNDGVSVGGRDERLLLIRAIEYLAGPERYN
jgi:hypothetical protein